MSDAPPTAWPPGLGPHLWSNLHVWALRSPNEPSGKEWLDGWIRSVPCVLCRNHAKGYVVDNPVRWGCEVFSWSVGLHNAVNRKLGKAELALEEARRIWGK